MDQDSLGLIRHLQCLLVTKIATLFGRKGRENTARASGTGNVLEYNTVHESYICHMEDCSWLYYRVNNIPVWSLNNSHTAQYQNTY